MLDYTKTFGKEYTKFEKTIFKDNADLYYSLVQMNVITSDELLWYQAFEGFSFLRNIGNKNEVLAAEIRRYIFLEKLKGSEIVQKAKNDEKCVTVYTLEDGHVFHSLRDEELLERMVKVIQEGYKKTNLTRDETNQNIPINPNRLKKKFLCEGTSERWPIIRLAFALEMSKSDFHKLVKAGAFYRDLSIAVPKEAILLYCLENDIHDWRIVEELSEYAGIQIKKYQGKVQNPDSIQTMGLIVGQEKRLEKMTIDDFKNNVLNVCCAYATTRQDEDEKQYSETALKIIEQYSIISELKNSTTNKTRVKTNDTVFVTDTILEYDKLFPVSEYGFTKVQPKMVMSRDTYFRFLNYRFVKPVGENNHARVMFSMEQGDLPEEISENTVSYSEVMNYPKKPHRIDRYDILITLFYYYLLYNWKKQGSALVASSQSEADQKWRSFMKFANANLQNAGYETITAKNPVDTLIRISMHAENPLECYTRICELNVLSSIANTGYSELKYPERKRVLKTIEALYSVYTNFLGLGIITEKEMKNTDCFCKRIGRAME